MTTEQTAQQLELAAQILRSGHPWEFESRDNQWGAPISQGDIKAAVLTGFKIRLALATPPDNRPIHNPDNLTAEQVGMGYRLLCAEDGVPSGKVDTWMFGGWRSSYDVDKKHLHECDKTYRIPLSIPWPEPKPDPYADEKKTVPLGPEDVPPCCAFRRQNESSDYIMPTSVYVGGIYGHDEIVFRHTWEYLKEHYQVNRSIPLTGKWNPDAWEPCHKFISENG